MDATKFYNQQMNEIPSIESIFAGTMGVTYKGGEIENPIEEIHSKEEMIAFAEAYYNYKIGVK